MSRVEFFPYPVASGALQLTCIAGGESVSVGETGRYLASELDESAALELDLRVEFDPSILDKLVPDSERGDPPVHAMVIARSIKARIRRAIELSENEEGVWGAKLQIPKRELYGDVELEPTLVRSSVGSANGFARHVGALLATGEPVFVDIDEPPVPPGGYIEVRFEDFRNSANHSRRQNSQTLYALDTAGDTPIIWLNDSVPEFKAVMLSEASRGGNLRVRDAMFDTIVSQAWTTLASVAFVNLAARAAEFQPEDTDDDRDVVDDLSEWEQRVVTYWAPLLFPDLTRAEAIEQVVEFASDLKLITYLFEQMTLAVQKQARTSNAFRGLIRLRDREGV